MTGWRLAAGLALTALSVGCVISARGQSEFEGQHELDGVQTVQLELPSTPMTVQACTPQAPDCPARLDYTGRWSSLGGTRRQAEDHARAPLLTFEVREGVGELRAEIPFDVRGLVDLELDTLTIPADRHLSVTTDLGDVEVLDVTASVTVTLEVGNIHVRGADDGLAVFTGYGYVVAETPGVAHIETLEGSVEVVQTGGARELTVVAERGDVRVSLADDADLDLEIHAQRIRVQTPSIRALTRASFSRRTGTGQFEVILKAPRGSVDLQQP